MATPHSQDKKKEIDFFDSYGASGAYDVFTPATNERIVDIVTRLLGLPPSARIADLGCGTGVFTGLLHWRGFASCGVDLSPSLIRIAREKYPDIVFLEGDIERLPFADASLDGVLLAGVLHHLPDRAACAAEIKRILRPGGRFAAFDPNRNNPFMYLYRDRSSPFYSAYGVTENERPVMAGELAETFRAAGFTAGTEFHSGLKYRYIASPMLRWLLPAYNAADQFLFRPKSMERMRQFVFTFGEKPREQP
ncbi:MAG: class I SAM-dependent methyltransferase [Pseudolabrys sp.]|jgi:SAM-dependent methyltransferase